jgi:hypothetical protein
MDWVLPTNEVLAKVEKLATEQRAARELSSAAVIGGQRQNRAIR